MLHKPVIILSVPMPCLLHVFDVLKMVEGSL